MSSVPHPQRVHSVHVESIDGELCVYDTARQRVHALNHTAAFVWQRCDGRTAPVELAAALAAEASIDDAEAVVRLTLQELSAAHLLSAPLAEVAGVSRRDLLARGVAAAAIPAIYSIVAPTPIDAQSRPPGAPTLTSLAPNQGSAGTTVTVTLTGTNFVVGATTVTVAGGGVTVTNVVVGSTTSLTASFVLDPSAVPGARTVTVTTAGGTSGGQTFTVSAPATAAPTLISVSPNQGTQGSTVAVTLTGTNFVVGATTVAVGAGGVTVNTVVVSSSTSLTANFVLDAAATVGPRTVTVTTSGGTSGAQTFTVSLPVPTLTTVAPSQGIRGTTVALTLTGTNFVVGATTVNVSGTLVTVNTVVVSSSTSLTANFVLDVTAAPGGRAVTVTTAGGTSGPQTFTVGLLAPTLTSVAPNLGVQGTTVAVTLTGTNFVVGATTVAVSGAGVTVTGATVVDSTSLTANFVLDVTAALGARTVTVTTSFGTSGGQTFTINPPPPTLTSVTPNQGMRGTTVAVTLTGTNFVVGATAVNVSGAGVTVNAVVVSSSTSLTANFVLDGTAATGSRTVTVTTAGGTSGGQTFTINPGTTTFTFTPPGGVQTFTVPPGVTTLTVTAQGAQGGFGSPGGLGGSVIATLTVAPGEVLNVFVGGQGGTGAAGGLGGFNGGGAGGTGLSFFDGGGGGASDIRRGGTALSNRVVVAGGGGGGSFSGFGGAGGGTTGGAGTAHPPNVKAAGGGTQSAGGLGGANASALTSNGQPGASGIGGQGGPDVLGGSSGGGGGGGYYGGGGGAGGTAQDAGTGGGGSSFPPGATHTQGVRAGNGEVKIEW